MESRINDSKRKRVVVVGGSIAGLCCAHSLLRSEWLEVLVFERARSVTAAGAGLGVGPRACDALRSWGLGDALESSSLPLSMEENRALDSKRNDPVVIKDETYDHRAVHWSDLHRLIHDALPAGIVRWSHEVVSFAELREANGEPRVRVKVSKLGGAENESNVEEIDADFMVSADGSMSQTREKFIPNESRRYSGYCAWRGVLETSSEHAQEVAETVKKAYPDLGKCLYFDIAEGTHAGLYELLKKRLNWLWYINQPEPQLKGKSVTLKADEKAIKELHEQAQRTWPPELAKLMQSTASPFINAIFDREPLGQFVWGRVVLVGEAAHPTTPHGLRSTNMSIDDAFVLGNAIAKWGPDQIEVALDEYQGERVPAATREVLFSRHLGKLKQGLLIPGIDWLQAEQNLKEQLLQKNVHSFQPSEL
ncbi:uncharacterized protein [Physcomitrium patens]|uniref:FAD-binding domain-containing protein n=1 Tax=Physcomitrium patens TaxID=3218 RepID=A0A2K1IZK6_PHYPA|nr:uncharacterized protein LOC112295540 [Physcomitrium patens]PNR34707.1 hypothetical protein PHYPA_022605 [Physcomitrium patens]|eukprot:XP_024403064.1 uncharacterized protein LOC112295540 [Physcomitrella patens]